MTLCTVPIPANPHSKTDRARHEHRSNAPEQRLYQTARLVVALSLTTRTAVAPDAADQLRQTAVRLANECLQGSDRRATVPASNVDHELRRLIGAIERCEDSGALSEPVLASLWHLTAQMHAQLQSPLHRKSEERMTSDP